jgi:hypothetical protein
LCCTNLSLNRYADPDADHREDYDGPPVEERANRRFNKKFMERNNAALIATSVEGIEAQELVTAGGVVVQDLTPTEVDAGPSGHVALRENLVRNFGVLWKKRQVQWLKYPARKGQGQ